MRAYLAAVLAPSLAPAAVVLPMTALLIGPTAASPYPDRRGTGPPANQPALVEPAA